LIKATGTLDHPRFTSARRAYTMSSGYDVTSYVL